MNIRSLFLIPAALALGAPSHANAYVGLRLNLAVPLFYPSGGYEYPAPRYYQATQLTAVGEQVTVAPGPGYVWMAGHWTNVAQRWVWVAGHWELPPSPSALWVAGHWVRANAGWAWVDGAWTIGGTQPSQPPIPPAEPAASANPPPQATPEAPQAGAVAMPAPSTPPPPPDMADGTVVGTEPPAPIVESVPVCPTPDYVWLGGFWGWNGIGWYWNAGHYGPRPFRGAAWVGGGWARASRGWAWHGGGRA